MPHLRSSSLSLSLVLSDNLIILPPSEFSFFSFYVERESEYTLLFFFLLSVVALCECC